VMMAEMITCFFKTFVLQKGSSGVLKKPTNIASLLAILEENIPV
jgi:hypothetical protein